LANKGVKKEQKVKKTYFSTKNVYKRTPKTRSIPKKFGQCFLGRGGIFIPNNLKIYHILQKT
jgi:hypothetical protein